MLPTQYARKTMLEVMDFLVYPPVLVEIMTRPCDGERKVS
jgi:hypothetical protein